MLLGFTKVFIDIPMLYLLFIRFSLSFLSFSLGFDSNQSRGGGATPLYVNIDETCRTTIGKQVNPQVPIAGPTGCQQYEIIIT